MEKHTKKILKEMCKRVGGDFDKINFKKENWFMKYSWSEGEQEKFREWFKNYLYEHSEARKEIMRFPFKRKENIEKVTGYFLLNYGWKIK